MCLLARLVPNVPIAKPRRVPFCGHLEQVKVGSDWKCVACGQVLTSRESVQNSIELSEAMSSAIASVKPLNESLEEMMGHKEWEEMRSKIPTIKKRPERRRKTQKRAPKG